MIHFINTKKVGRLHYTICFVKSLKQWLLTLAILFPILSSGQSNVAYSEYFIDQDPGLNSAISIPITPGIDIQNVAVTIDVTNFTRGIHFFGSRSRTSSGIWSMTHYWFIFKPYIAFTPGALTNTSRVEYYVDVDPGIGNGISVPVTPGTILVDLSFSIDPVPLVPGTHIIGTRAMTSDGLWSKTNFWLFFKPYSNFASGTLTNTNYVEYFTDTDPGVGLATSVPVTAGLNISDVTFPVITSGLVSGLHIVGTRAKDVSGNWSMTNYWLFVKPYNNISPLSLPNTNALEYFLDYDPGTGNGIAVTIAAGTNLSDLTFNVDISNIVPGAHFVTVRAKDANGNWSMLNAWPFTIPGTPPVLSTLVSTTTLCAGSSINVGYQLSSPITFNAGNNFIAQLSDVSGNFTTPRLIGSLSSTLNSGSFTCVIPADVPTSGSYRIRVLSTSQAIVGANNGSNITVYALAPVPNISSPAADTTVCQGNQLQIVATNVSGSPQWLLNGANVVGANSATYTVPNATSSNAGAYKLRVYSTGTCYVESSVINIAINTNVPATPTLSPSGAVGICLGSGIILTSSSGTSNQWYKDGALIPGATSQTYNVTQGGTYTVQAGNGTGCFATSSNNAVVTVGVPPTTPTISAGGPTTFCSGGNVTFSSSNFNNNQWLRNGAPIPGAINQNYTASQSGFYKVVASNSGCNVTSDSIAVTVNPLLTPSISIISSTNYVPLGTSITFTATPVYGGPTPQYSFRVNGTVVQTGSSNIYTTTTLTNGASVNCTLTSNALCLTSNNVASNNVVITIAGLVTMSGRISHPLGMIIPGVKVGVSGGVVDSVFSDPTTGNYNFNLFQQRNYTVSPSKNNDVIKAKGVDVLDVLQMQAHILNTTPLNSPYKIIAADVNGDNAVNIFDVILTKRLILGIDTSFPVNRLWAFVDSSQVFGNPLNPFPYNSTKSFSNLASNQVNQSFYGVKLGDVNFDWIPTSGQYSPTQIPGVVKLYYDTVIAEAGDVARLHIRVKDFKNLMGVQFTIGFDKDLFKFVRTENKLLPIQENDKFSENGAITFIWADGGNKVTTLDDGSAIFDLLLLKKHPKARADINLDQSYTPALAYGKNYSPYTLKKTDGLILEKVRSIVVTEEKLDIRPNPSEGVLRLYILSKATKQVMLTITDNAGRTVLQKQIPLELGDNILALDVREQSNIAAGIYYLKIQGLENVGTKKLVITNK